MRKTILITAGDLEDYDKAKVDWIVKYLGAKNVCTIYIDEPDYFYRQLMIKCNKKQWKKIKFKFDLGECYF